jgi:hypothetical protein
MVAVYCRTGGAKRKEFPHSWKTAVRGGSSSTKTRSAQKRGIASTDVTLTPMERPLGANARVAVPTRNARDKSLL